MCRTQNAFLEKRYTMQVHPQLKNRSALYRKFLRRKNRNLSVPVRGLLVIDKGEIF